MEEWIYIKDRLPEDSTSVIVYSEDSEGGTDIGIYTYEETPVGGGWFYDKFDCHYGPLCNVIAWMPVPDKPGQIVADPDNRTILEHVDSIRDMLGELRFTINNLHDKITDQMTHQTENIDVTGDTAANKLPTDT